MMRRSLLFFVLGLLVFASFVGAQTEDDGFAFISDDGEVARYIDPTGASTELEETGPDDVTGDTVYATDTFAISVSDTLTTTTYNIALATDGTKCVFNPDGSSVKVYSFSFFGFNFNISDPCADVTAPELKSVDESCTGSFECEADLYCDYNTDLCSRAATGRIDFTIVEITEIALISTRDIDTLINAVYVDGFKTICNNVPLPGLGQVVLTEPDCPGLSFGFTQTLVVTGTNEFTATGSTGDGPVAPVGVNRLTCDNGPVDVFYRDGLGPVEYNFNGVITVVGGYDVVDAACCGLTAVLVFSNDEAISIGPVNAASPGFVYDAVHVFNYTKPEQLSCMPSDVILRNLVAGASCMASQICDSGNCDNGVCVDVSCQSSVDCPLARDCVNGLCVGDAGPTLKADGAACSVDSECSSGVCTDGVCGPAGPAGVEDLDVYVEWDA